MKAKNTLLDRTADLIALTILGLIAFWSATALAAGSSFVIFILAINSILVMYSAIRFYRAARHKTRSEEQIIDLRKRRREVNERAKKRF